MGDLMILMFPILIDSLLFENFLIQLSFPSVPGIIDNSTHCTIFKSHDPLPCISLRK